MTWDADINPEGLAEQFKRRAEPSRILPISASSSMISQSPECVSPAVNRQDQYMFGWQAGASFKLNGTDNIQVAPTIYNYVNNKTTSKNFAGRSVRPTFRRSTISGA